MNLAAKAFRGFVTLFLVCAFLSCNLDKDLALYPSAIYAASLNTVDTLNFATLDDVMMQAFYLDVPVNE